MWIGDQTMIDDNKEVKKDKYEGRWGNITKRKDNRWSRELVDWFPMDNKVSIKLDGRWRDEIKKLPGKS